MRFLVENENEIQSRDDGVDGKSQENHHPPGGESVDSLHALKNPMQ